MNNFYPISLNLNNKSCIVVGGGSVALRRVSKLLESGAIITLISPATSPKFKDLIETDPNLSWVKSHYIGKEDLKGASLVFAATDDPAVNHKICHDAHSLGILTNIASSGDFSDFIIPSSFNIGDLQVSVSTSGKVPGLSKAITQNLQETFDPEYETLVNLLAEIRHLIIAQSDPKKQNRYILSDITANYKSILEELSSGMDINAIRTQLLALLK